MKHVIARNRGLVGVFAALIVALAFGHAAQAGPAEPPAPDEIAVEAGHKVFLVGHAVGVQIHTCIATPDGYAWRFDGPLANVYDDRGKLVMTHFAGPRWQATDGSVVRAEADRRFTVDPSAIPWLRLKVTERASGPDGDRLYATTFIQRLATVGGLAPPQADCNAATVGTTENVPYTADYAFWKAIGS
jgi:hypothetical protein